MMKKMSTKRDLQSHGQQTEALRQQSERLEQQRIQFEQSARMARTNLYGLAHDDQRGWVDAKNK